MCKACSAFVEIDEPSLERARRAIEEVGQYDLSASLILIKIVNAFEIVQETYRKERDSMMERALYDWDVEGEVEN